MLVQPRWEVLEYSVRECAGVLRRRMPTRTVLGALAVYLGLMLLGADAFLGRDATLLAIVATLVGTVWVAQHRGVRLTLALAARRLKRLDRARWRAGFAGAREFVDAGANARVERRFLPHAAEALLRAQDFGRYYPLHEAPVECLTGIDAVVRHHEPAGAPGTDQPRQ